jgi:1-deoxy-D-xylulose-5-phosphate reductoisomerase
MVEFADGSIKAQLGHPDMRLPIQYALSFPERLPNPQLPKLDWDKIKELTFEAPNFANFPCLQLAMEAERQGGTYPAVLCAADEVAVELFLSQRIKFSDIARLVERSLSGHQVIVHPTIEEIIAADDWARKTTKEFAAGASRC